MSDFDSEGTQQSSLRKIRLPFGDPDGARADLDNNLNEFITLDEKRFSSGIATSDLDRNIRIIVGKKGSGKTVYLRRLQDSSRKEESVFASKIAKDIPATNSVVEFCQTFDPEKVTEAWQIAWRISILLSTASTLCSKQYFSQYVDQNNLAFKLHQIIPRWKFQGVERSPYSELKDVISKFRSEKLFWDYSNSSAWDDLQTILGTELKKCPPIFIYLDASDDEFAHAPMEWHRCQKGLFYAVMRLLSLSGALGSRLHTVIAIRDIVYSSVLQSEHQTRYIGSPNISLLDWDQRSIRYFLDGKIKTIPREYFRDNFPTNMYNFIGLTHVRNLVREVEEDAISYLIRHTRCLPRDIVQMGNAIAAAKQDFDRSENSNKTWEAQFRHIVSRMSAVFGAEQIAICANQLSSHEAPSRSARQHYAEFYTSNKEYVSSRSKIIHEYIRQIGQERFCQDELNAVDQKFSNELPKDVKISSILWQNGLIGYKRRKSDDYFEFYSLSKSAGFNLPTDCAEFVFRSVLIDAVQNIKVGKGPPPLEL